MSSRHTSAAQHPGVAQFHRGPERAVVHVVKDAALATLLRGRASGLSRPGVKALAELAAHAAPAGGMNAPVTFYGNDIGHAADALAAVLAKARALSDPAAGQLAALAAQLGVTEPAPEPAPAATAARSRQALREQLGGA